MAIEKYLQQFTKEQLIEQINELHKKYKEVKDKQSAIKTHENVGKVVRDAIKRIGGTPPEQLPPAEHIKQVEKRVKSAAPKLELEEKDAKGLIGKSEEE